ncbi:MAG: DNA polymerase III subunit beta [Oscillospiraceae bacterium]|jgi:DNA polymerase-3 subunit beta|nr:DNA polymerase III subunit beta [Oscillospiraceae bacterium]
MKFSCLANDLATALQNTARVVAIRSSLSAVGGILLETTEDHVSLVGYNFDIAITAKIPAKIETPGRIVLGAKLLTDIMRHIPEGVVTAEVNDLHFKITNNNLKFDIIGINAQEYPELPDVASQTEVILPAEKFKDLVNKTVYAASTDETKLTYTGALLKIEKEQMTIVALDGFRLAKKTEIVNTKETISVICPSRSLQEVARLISHSNQEVFINIATNIIMFRIGDYKVISKLLEGTFLDYGATIPEEFGTHVVANTENLINCVERTSIVVQDKLKAPILLNVSTASICLNCEGPTGCASDELPCSVHGAELKIGFNSRLLLDALRACGTNEVSLKFSGNLSPVIIESADESNNFLFLVLPIRTESD